MPTYRYKAKDPKGKTITGTITVANEAAVTARLERMGNTPLSITGEKPSVWNISFGPQRVKIDHMVAFTRQFATIVKAGVPIVQGLGILSEQTESTTLKDVLKKVMRDIEGGASLSQAISKFPNIFSDLYVNSVVAGEAGGVLDTVLLRLAELMERDSETAANVRGALQYPIITLVAMGIASFILVVFVVPRFASIYGRFKEQLPLPTRVLIGANYLIVHHWYFLIAGVATFGFLFHRYASTRNGRFQIDLIKLRLPVFGVLFMKVAMGRFSAMLMTLNSSGLPILRSLEIVAATVGNAVIGREIDLLRRSVADGRGISGSILESKIFPPMVGHMISIGETTGSLDDMLSSVASYYDLEVKSMIKNLTTLIEPIMTAILGVVVLGMALAIFLPLWNMIQLFRK